MIKSNQSYGEGSTCSSLISDISCDSITHESPVELVPYTKENSVEESWRSTTVRTSQQQIIDCVVDSMCDSGVESGPKWISNDVNFQFEPKNNNVYKSAANCCNPSDTTESVELNLQSSHLNELLTHQSCTSESIEEINKKLIDDSSFIILNHPEENSTESAVLVEIEADTLPDEHNTGEYKIHILNSDQCEVDPLVESAVVVNDPQHNSVDQVDNREIEYQQTCSKQQPWVTVPGDVKPVRACKGVRYREFMSTNKFGKRRVKQKER